MAIQSLAVTGGPGTWDLVKALFMRDSLNTVTLFLKWMSQDKINKMRRQMIGRSVDITHVDRVGVEVCNPDLDFHEIELCVHSVAQLDKDDEWMVVGDDYRRDIRVTVYFSTKTRRGVCDIDYGFWNQDVKRCDWCCGFIDENDSEYRVFSGGEDCIMCESCHELGLGDKGGDYFAADLLNEEKHLTASEAGLRYAHELYNEVMTKKGETFEAIEETSGGKKKKSK